MSTGAKRFFVLTGGPGGGKTTLLNALGMAGYAVVPEAGRAIIREQEAIGGPGHHHGDRLLYRELMLSRDMAGYSDANEVGGTVFFDRGVPDLVGYSHLIGAPVPRHLDRAARLCRYQPHVFVAPPWAGIFAADRERRQDFAEAVATHDAMIAAYRDYGYQLVNLPLTTVPDRVAFVRAALRDWGMETVVPTPR